MKVHHLDCCTMCPRGGHLINGDGWPWQPGMLVGHVLLIESDDGLILVDTGIGERDCETPGRLGGVFVNVVRPRLDKAQTAIGQVRAMGFDPKDVRHLVLTHLDVDHAGGIPDFPHAKVHVLKAERDAALNPTFRERDRYRKPHFAHGPDWVAHEVAGESWKGFAAVHELGVGPEVLLIPTIGHTRGHCAVAVNSDDGWLLHCGDAYFHEREVDPADGGCTPGLTFFQNLVAVDRNRMRENKGRLRELVAGHSDVTVFSAHDPNEFERLR